MRKYTILLFKGRRKKKKLVGVIQGSTEIWTRIAGFKVQSANHYTIEPLENVESSKVKQIVKTIIKLLKLWNKIIFYFYLFQIKSIFINLI